MLIKFIPFFIKYLTVRCFNVSSNYYYPIVIEAHYLHRMISKLNCNQGFQNAVGGIIGGKDLNKEKVLHSISH